MNTRILLAASAAVLALRCAEGPPHLENTAVTAISPGTILAYFSEPVSADCADTSRFLLTNASTGDTLPLASAGVNGPVVTLSLQAPAHVLTAAHVYDLSYDVYAESNGARAHGTSRFLADFHPPSDFFFYNERLEAWRDSAGTTLLLWTPDNRIGNTAIEIWRKTGPGDSSRAVSIEPNRSAWYLYGDPSSTQYALRAVNPYAVSPLSAWTVMQDSLVSAFPCAGVCLSELAWDSLAAGFGLVPKATTCDRVEYRSDSLGMTLVRRITEHGVLETQTDSSGTTEHILNWCP